MIQKAIKYPIVSNPIKLVSRIRVIEKEIRSLETPRQKELGREFNRILVGLVLIVGALEVIIFGIAMAISNVT